jgi:hypothetical protein
MIAMRRRLALESEACASAVISIQSRVEIVAEQGISVKKMPRVPDNLPVAGVGRSVL